jgi:hypothetical protein
LKNGPVNRFVAVVPVKETPTAVMLDETGPYTVTVPLVVDPTAGPPMADAPPETIKVPIDEFVIVLSVVLVPPKILPVTIITPLPALFIAGPELFPVVGPVILPTTLTTPIPAWNIVPPKTVLTPDDTEPDTFNRPDDKQYIIREVVPPPPAVPPVMLPVIERDELSSIMIAHP